jgi:hypothetical protein
MPKDTGWWRREHVVELGEEFGPVGPAVLDWLSCEAKLQNDGGNVKAGPRTLARGVFSDLVTVRNVLSRAVTIGALHHFEEHDGRFTCTISGWSSDNQRGWNAFRQADYRAKNAEEVTERNALSRPVAPREEKSREEKTTTLFLFMEKRTTRQRRSWCSTSRASSPAGSTGSCVPSPRTRA